MALVDTDLFLVQDAATKTNYKISFENLTLGLESTIDLDTSYVKKDGDNITGDITLGEVGDPKITLFAATGNITIDGTFSGQTGQFTKLQGYAGLELYGDPISPVAITIDTQGDVVISGELTAESDSEFKTSVLVTNDVTLGGKLTANSAQFTTKVEGDAGLLIYSSPSVQKGIEIDSAGNVNLTESLTVIGDTDIDGSLTVTGDTILADVTADKFTGKFVGDGSELTDLPVIEGLWEITGKDLSPIENNGNLKGINNITIAGELQADKIDGGEYV